MYVAWLWCNRQQYSLGHAVHVIGEMERERFATTHLVMRLLGWQVFEQKEREREQHLNVCLLLPLRLCDCHTVLGEVTSRHEYVIVTQSHGR